MHKRILLISMAMLLAVLACGTASEPAPTQALEADQSQVAESADSSPEGSAQEGAGNENILFQDDFQDGQPDGWDVTAAWDVQQAGDLYTFEASGDGGAWVPSGNAWSNYAYQVSARLDAGSLLLSLNLSQSGRYMVRMDEAGLYLVKESPSKNYTVVNQTGPVSLGNWHHMDIRAYNGHVQVYVDNQLWVDYIDSAPLSKGTIAVTSQDGSQVAVDDVLVTTTGPLPAGVVQAPPPLDLGMDLDMGDGGEVVFEADAHQNQGDSSTDQNEQPADQQSGEQHQDGQDQGQDEQQDGDQQQSPGLPDLVVLEATFDPDPVVSGQQFLANFMVTNQGDAPAGAFTLLWKFHAATGLGVCSWDYESLDAGQTVWGACTRLTNAQPGQSPTSLTVDVEGEVVEVQEDNNQRSPTLNVVTAAQDGGGEAEGEEPEGGELPDLVIEGIYLTADDTIRCDVRNRGPGDAPAGVRIALFIDGERVDRLEVEPGIPAGTANSKWFSDLELDLPVEARCVADGGNLIPETNNDNNALVRTLEN